MPSGATTGGGEPPATLRSEHAEATRRAVLAAARSLFGRNGYAQTSVDEIAATARVTKGAVYHHFAGKEALFRTVFMQAEAEAEARADEAADPAAAPVDQIVARVNAYLDAALDTELRRIVLVDGPAVLGPEGEGSVDQQPGHVGLRSFIAASAARGQVTGLDPDLLAYLVRGLAWLGGLRIAYASDPAATRAALGQAIDVMLRGLAPGQSR
ncbi:MAG TPA: TetR/AcrR family transcriptional regulator [Streptosporangiaceae bacterium]